MRTRSDVESKEPCAKIKISSDFVKPLRSEHPMISRKERKRFPPMTEGTLNTLDVHDFFRNSPDRLIFYTPRVTDETTGQSSSLESKKHHNYHVIIMCVTSKME